MSKKRKTASAVTEPAAAAEQPAEAAAPAAESAEQPAEAAAPAAESAEQPAEAAAPAAESAEQPAEAAAPAAESAEQPAEETAPTAESAKPADKKRTAKQPNGFLLLSGYRGAIMGIAAIWILVFHEWMQVTVNPEDGSFHLINFLERYIKAIGFCGVDIFLLLSGIGLTFAMKKESLLKFYYRRLRRILLPFLTIAVIRWRLEHWDFKIFLGNISGVRFYRESMYSFLWFVPAIVTLYLLFPLYFKLFCKAKDKIMFTAGTITLWMLITLLVRDKMRGDLFGFTNRIPVFVIGVLFGWMTQNRKEIIFTLQTWIHLLITLSLGLYLAYISNFFGYGLIVPVSNCCIPNCLIAVSFPFLVSKLLHILERNTVRFGKGLAKVLGFFGAFSLEFYCVQEWFSGIMIPKLTEKGWTHLGINLAIFVMVTAISWAASMVFKYFWKLVELPFRKREPDANTKTGS